MSDRPQHLYVMQLGEGVLKIGISHKPAARVRQLGRIGGRKPSLIWQTEVPSLTARETETRVKAALRWRRISGEWFICTPQKMSRVVQKAIADTGSGQFFLPAEFKHTGSGKRRMPWRQFPS